MPAAENDIYLEHVLEHAEDPYHKGRCPMATHGCCDRNPLCGDQVCIELRIDREGKIEDVYFDGHGCRISQAAASMLLECVDGKSVDAARHFTAEDMLKLFGARLTPNRQKCCLLAWRVLQQALFSPLAAGAAEPSPAVGDTA